MPKRKRTYDLAGPLDSTDQVLEVFIRLNAHIDDLLEPVRADLQAVLDRLAGRNFGSLEANQAVAVAIQQLLIRLERRVRCQGCGQPASLRCRLTTQSKSGCFQFDHRFGGRSTNHMGPTSLPRLELVPLPPDRRRRDFRRGKP